MDLSKIRAGMVGFSGGNAFIQKAIRFFTGSWFSHSFQILQDATALDVFQTTATITQRTALSLEAESSGWLWVVNPTKATDEEKRAAGYAVYLEFSNRRYGYESYLWFIWRWIMRKFGREPVRMWSWLRGGVTCTELTCNYLARLSPEYAALFAGRDLNTLSPEELRNIVIWNPELFAPVGWVKPLPEQAAA